MSNWIPTDSMLPPFGKRVLLAYSAFQDDGKGGKVQVHTYTCGALNKQEGWISDEGMIDDAAQFDTMCEPDFWMPIDQAPPF